MDNEIVVADDVYLAGPMSGIPDFNYPAFHAAARAIRGFGVKVANPADNFDGDQTLPWLTYLALAIRQVTEATTVVVLPGWETSEGAGLEVYVAYKLGLKIVDYKTYLAELAAR